MTELFSIVGFYTGWRGQTLIGYSVSAEFDGHWWASGDFQTVEEADRAFYAAAHRAFICKYLGKLGIAVPPPRSNEPVANAIVNELVSLGSLIPEVIAEHQQEATRWIIDALAPSVPPPLHILAEARMAAHARRAVLSNAEWLTAAQIAEHAGFSTSNTSTQPNRWEKEGLIFAINHQNTDYFPAYGLDPATFRPVPALAGVLKTFKGTKDAWGLAYWFAAENGFLGGKRPQDLLSDAPDEVIAAAKDEMAGVAHG